MLSVPARLAGLLRTLVTRMTAALWHGLLPGYYLFFVSTVLIDQSYAILRKRLAPRFASGTELGRKYGTVYFGFFQQSVSVAADSANGRWII